MKTPRVGSVAKEWDRGDHPGADQEGADQREREGQDGEQHRPDLQGVALLHHHGGMQERGAGDPGHERGVLDGVPEPPAAPAEFVIRPVRAHRDAQRQEAPRGERPGPHRARPDGVDPPVDQRGDREGEADREADIADVEERRVDREAGILQQRVEVVALQRRRDHAAERVRGRDDEQHEHRGDQALHAQRVGAQPRRHGIPRHRHAGAEQGEDQDPEEHRALVVPPDAGDLVDQRLLGVRVLDDVLDREIRGDIRPGQRREGEEHAGEGAERRLRGGLAERRVARARRPDGHHRLDDGDREREREGEMAGLDDHAGSLTARCGGRGYCRSTRWRPWGFPCCRPPASAPAP